MALTRAQLLMGDNSQQAVLPGQVQGVKEGVGVKIDFDGTISFDPDTASGVVRLNNSTGFNNYIWPSAPGVDIGTFLCISEAGSQYVLSWQNPSFGPVVVVDDTVPTPGIIGKLWFDTNERNLKVFENSSSLGSWTPVSRGNPVLPVSVSSFPAFSQGDGSDDNPYETDVIMVTPGEYARSSNLITITNLAPYQYVPIIDQIAYSNGYRFSPTNYFADENGILRFYIQYQDFPATLSNQSYSSIFKIGFSSCFISASSEIIEDLRIDNPGSISGTAQVGESLTYTQGAASGGAPPYTYTWVWRDQLSDSTLQTNGSLFTVPSGLVGDRVYVELTVTDSGLRTATSFTSYFPLSPSVIERSSFPNTDIAYPSTTTEEVPTLWLDANTVISASGCIEFKVNAGSYSQGPTSINNGDTITTRWLSTLACGGAPSGTTISGCLFDSEHQDCGSLLLSRIPSPFSFNPVSSIVPGGTGTSNTIVPMGVNATSYVSYSGTSTATSIEASIDGGAFSALPTFGSNTFAINPGQTLQIRATTGASASTSYTAIINIGEGTSVQSAPFDLNTSAASNFATPIDFPVITSADSAAVTWLAGDGSVTLTSTGCIEFSVNAGAFSQGPTAITTGDTIVTRWSSGGSCGGATHGTTITGTVTDGVSTNYASLTIDRVPASFNFTNLTAQSTTTLVTSNILNIAGFNASSYITRSTPPSGSSLTSVEASVAGGPWTAIPTSGTTLSIDPVASGPGNTLQIRGITGASTNTTYGIQINTGEGTSIQTSVWTATTAAVVPAVVTPSILTPINGSINLTPYASTPAGITVTSSAYSAINGAGTHASTDWEIRKNSTGGTVVFSGNSITSLTSYFLDASFIEPGFSYFVRCRYYSNDMVPVVSSWSTWSQFSTAATFSLVWTQRVSPGTGIFEMIAVTWIGAATNRFVAVGPAGRATRVSSNGITWSNGGGTLSSGNNMFAIAPGFGVYENTLVCVGQNGVINQSTNGGLTWTVPAGSTNTGKGLQCVVCNPSGRWVAGGNDGVLRTTTNLSTTWTAVSSGTGNGIVSVVWDDANSQFIANTRARILTSSDGLTWTVSPTINPAGYPYGSYEGDQILVVPGSPQRYVWLAEPGSREGNYWIAVSEDLSSWTAYIPSPTQEPVNAGAVGGNFIAIGGHLEPNYDGISDEILSALTTNFPYVWGTPYKTPNPNDGLVYTAMTYSPTLNRFVGFGNNGAVYSTS